MKPEHTADRPPRHARIAGFLAELGVQEIWLHEENAAPRLLLSRITDLPGELDALSGRLCRLESAEPKLVVHLPQNGIATIETDDAAAAALWRKLMGC